MQIKATTCRRCGKTIWMVLNERTRVWVACDKELWTFDPDPDSAVFFISESGKSVRGRKSPQGSMAGYLKHPKNCTAR